MSAITSELYMKSSSLVDEKVCVGLFVIEGENVFFDYSEHKFKLAHRLNPSLDKGATLHWLKNLKEKISKDHSNDELGLFRSDFNSSTLSYLNTYSKGVFLFSEPKPIDAKIDAAYFARLFKRIVDSELSGDEATGLRNTLSFKSAFRSIIRRESFKRIDIAYTVEPEVLSGIYTPHIVEFIGKNGNFIAGDTIDFTAKPSTIEKSLFEFDRIAKGLKILAKRHNLPNEGKYFAYFSPPEETDGKRVLDLARKDDTKNFVLKELDHLEKLSDTLEDGGYHKFSEWVEAL
jgi:hypothetical protein